MKNLQELLNDSSYIKIIGNVDKDIIDITADSRMVKEGSLFICLSGYHVDGHKYVSEAVEKGAVAIIAEKKISVPEGVTVVYVKSTRTVMEKIAPLFFDYPSKSMRMIAVTGTNGKTTTTHIISHILKKAGYKTGVIGTIHALIGDEEFETHNTTPDVIDLQRLLYKMKKAKVTHVCMEVSSHSLVLGRVEGCEFDTAVFSNLTEDHLDFHKTMINYANAKAKLFSMVSEEGQVKPNKNACINIDDDYSHIMIDAIKDRKLCKLHTFSMNRDAELKVISTEFTGKNTKFICVYKNKEYPVTVKLMGRFNVYNIMAAMSAAISEGIDFNFIIKALTDFTNVPGRFELIDEGQEFSVVVDYAHTPDGLENILTTAREITTGKIIVVFGCGGDRDPMKRPIMGRIAAKYSDIAIVTSDNPRTEDPNSIVEQVVKGVKENAEKYNCKYKVLVDRRSAIKEAIEIARVNDIVIIAGKGHEDYQILKNKTIHFDDREEARRVLRG